MSKAPKKSPSGSAKKGRSATFFTEQFGRKKESVHEKRGGTNRPDKELHKQVKKERKEGKASSSVSESPSFKEKSYTRTEGHKTKRPERGPGKGASGRYEKSERSDDRKTINDRNRKPYGRSTTSERPLTEKKSPIHATSNRGGHYTSKKKREASEPDGSLATKPEEMPLNKYIAHSGLCGRREAAEVVKQGKVKVNGKLILEPGYKVQPTDSVTLAGKKLSPVKDLVYIILNKPKDFVTTTHDPEGRKTVMQLVANAEVPRLYPIGRLDRNTTGVLIFTNDGALAQKLSHPKYNIKKVYQATLDKPISKENITQLTTGVTLEDGEAKADAAFILDSPTEVGLEIHSGRNRIVRRMFESLGYDVVKLDRVMFAGLTKKNVPRGKWRFLTDKEVIFLKHFK